MDKQLITIDTRINTCYNNQEVGWMKRRDLDKKLKTAGWEITVGKKRHG
ncbi:hypothetical protein Desru_2852 [Desulforamulus ruminis DSM 2154]|uniref:Uncharacterized protein n=1 Tax=Desulforamulus ruminis (strain ATCC 23193 / DSM 2154 / NCIMB 8452 / DL) TaxID=696281 RepID=F6DSH6_DESRL|nr:hypothetical protein Desru_2852 [Desulforamulus ruminis DSM 2154]